MLTPQQVVLQIDNKTHVLHGCKRILILTNLSRRAQLSHALARSELHISMDRSARVNRSARTVRFTEGKYSLFVRRGATNYAREIPRREFVRKKGHHPVMLGLARCCVHGLACVRPIYATNLCHGAGVHR